MQSWLRGHYRSQDHGLDMISHLLFSTYFHFVTQGEVLQASSRLHYFILLQG